jgi:hypothetical protein
VRHLNDHRYPGGDGHRRRPVGETGSAARILVGGAGGAAPNGFIRSLRASGRGDWVIGMNSSPTDLLLAPVDERHVVPHAKADDFGDALFWLLERTKPDLVHVQSDEEVRGLSLLRHVVKASGARLFLPPHPVIDTCQDKWSSYLAWRDAGLTVPRTRLISEPADLEECFGELGAPLWLRETVGAAGSGAIRTSDPGLARHWIAHRQGFGRFTAAECLTSDTVTWQSLWHEGELVVAQTRRRRSWAYSRNAPTGVTGITGVGETCSDPGVDGIAQRAIAAVTARPHGIFGVDMAYDTAGVPNPTEINVGRFFTTHEFFTRAGLNMPEIYVGLALERRAPRLERTINPLPDGLLWVRGMDVDPVLTTVEDVSALLETTPAGIAKGSGNRSAA